MATKNPTDSISAFDPALFMGGETESGFDTSYATVPPGEYRGQIDKVMVNKVNTKDGERAVMNVSWSILDEDVKKAMDVEKAMSRQTIWLELNDKGGLDRGKHKNVDLGKLLTGLGMNDGKPWSPSGLVGNLAMVKILHSPNQNDPENPYANVVSVSELA
jgi:hypothetical protein